MTEVEIIDGKYFLKGVLQKFDTKTKNRPYFPEIIFRNSERIIKINRIYKNV